MKKSEKTRQFIIERTAPIFNQKGYIGTSMADLTSATGLTKGAIYGNFESKEEVALSALDYNLKVLNQKTHQVSRQREGSREKLMAYIEFYKKSVKSSFFMGGCPIMNAAVDSDDMQPEIFRKVKAGLNKWRNYLIEIINTGIEKGEIKDTVQGGQFADQFISMIEGGILLSRTLGNRQHLLSNLLYLEKLIDESLIGLIGE